MLEIIWPLPWDVSVPGRVECQYEAQTQRRAAGEGMEGFLTLFQDDNSGCLASERHICEATNTAG